MRIFDPHAFRGLLLAVALAVGVPALAFEDPSVVSAISSERLLMSPLIAVASVGARTVAVGQRGHVALSDDGGQTWRQAQVPVSSDLVAVSFGDERNGWAVGQGGVVLHSADGGETWVKQLDGQDATRLINTYYGPGGDGSALADAQTYLDREAVLSSYGGTQALMAVHFVDANTGYVAGLFNRLLRTDDGGKTWEPWQHRIDNPGELHFYAMSADRHALYIAGEQGMVWRLGKGDAAFVAKPSGYDGTLFGVVSDGRHLVAFGMRGSVLRSINGGDNWARVEAQTQAGITSGAFLPDGSLLLGTLSGDIARSLDGGKSFKAMKLARSMPFFGLAAREDGQLTLVGAAGVQHEAVALEKPKVANPDVVVKNASATSAQQGEGKYGYFN
ncbi:Ycf48-like protein [compost metagenome]